MQHHETLDAVAETTTTPTPAPSKKALRAWILVGIAVAVAVLAAVLWMLFGGNNRYRAAIDLYFDVYVEADATHLEDIIPDTVWQQFADANNMTVEDAIAQMHQNNESGNTFGRPDSKYGANITVTYDILDVENADEDLFEQIRNYLSSTTDIDDDAITEIVHVKLEATLKGSDDEDTEEYELTLIQIDGRYYVYKTITMFISVSNHVIPTV